MSEQSAPPESGSLSVEQAIAALTPEPPVEQDTPEAAPAEAAAGDAENTEGEASSPEEPAAEAETLDGAEAEGKAEPEAETLPDPPLYWSPDGKAKWAELSPEARAEILAQEGPRETAVAKAKAEAAELSQRAKAEVGKVQQLAEALAERVPQWVETFKGDVQRFTERWGATPPNWIAYAQENGVDAANWAKLQFDTELGALQATQGKLQEAERARQIAQTQAYEADRTTFAEELKQIAPDLVEPVKGPTKQAEIMSYLEKQGISKENLPHISATEMVLARKAMLYDLAQSQLKAAPKPKPSAPAKPASVRPAAAQAQSSNRPADVARNRFAQTRSIDDAVAVLLSKGR